nr:homeobox 1 [Jatropha curcas]
MCKGLVMERIRTSVRSEGKKRFIYVGDGTPDFCATLKLEEGDFVMPRKNFPLCDFIYGNGNKNLIKANIQEWSDGEELSTNLLNAINTIIIQEDYNVRPDDPLVPLDCKFQTSSISAFDVCTRNPLPIPR